VYGQTPDAVPRARRRAIQRTSRSLIALSLESVKTLLDLQGKDQPASVRHAAARTTLEYGVKLRESADLSARVAALEAQLTPPRDDFEVRSPRDLDTRRPTS
jgi:hypothetical protein